MLSRSNRLADLGRMAADLELDLLIDVDVDVAME